MDKQSLKSTLREASDVVAELPKHLQEKAFELAVGFLVGVVPADTKALEKVPKALPGQHQLQHKANGEHADISDLLKHCTRNPDRYVIFLHDMEARGEEANNESLLTIFKRYKQDRPQNVNRDLQELVAKDLIQRSGKDSNSPWTLKRKGRARHVELTALASGNNA